MEARTRWAAVAGLASGAAALASAELVAALIVPAGARIVPAGAPVTAVGSAVIDSLPAALVNWGKETLGAADKPVLLAIVVAAVLALAALAGVLETRGPGRGGWLIGLLAAVAAVAAGVRAGSWLAVLPSVVGAIVGVALLHVLVARLLAWRGDERAASHAVVPPTAVAREPASRRTFLAWTGATAVLAGVAAVGGRVLGAAADVVDQARSLLVLPTPVTLDPIPAGADLALEGLSPYVSPVGNFYRVDIALAVPQIAPEEWTLTVTGMVEHEITLTFAELLAMPMVEHVTTLACVSNGVGGDLVDNATWLGLPIRELLARAGPLAGADMVLSTGEDGFSAGTPLEALTDPAREALLAVAMNGEPLPPEHGFPVRMVVPGLFGYVSATKWVRELRVTTFARDEGYWTPLGWAALGPVKTASRIDVPRGGTARSGSVVVAGVAWDQHTGIAGVEVGIDGEWHACELAEVTGPDTWRQWAFTWDATPGRHEIAVRATNADGETQTSEEASPVPDGATGWHTIVVDVT